MEKDNTGEECFKFLKRLREKGKSLAEFGISINLVQNEASSKGLDDKSIKVIIDILKRTDLGSNKTVSLIKCMIPKDKISDGDAKKMITWFLAQLAPVSVLNMILVWLIGCWEYQLISRNSVYIFYDALFYTLINQEKVESHLAHLIYLITKPEDVTRGQVTRLLKLNARYKKPQKHVTALLSLFKSYKPEFVPEKILAINIQSVWKPIVDVLRISFEDARDRINLREAAKSTDFNVNWNLFQGTKVKKNQEPLVPSIGYFNIGSDIFKDKTEKSIFDISNITQLGQYHPVFKLPCKATSLLTNSIGYHLLTYADFEYQQRFMYNLYYTFWRSFIFEKGRYSDEEMNKILDMTMEFSKYMQHGISIVNYFINEYLSCYMDEYHLKLLSLMQWSTISTSELQDYMLKHLKLIFYASSLDVKCKVIRTLRALQVNLSVINNDSFKGKTFPFLGQSFDGKIAESIHVIDQFAKELIISALNIHCYDSSLISEVLSYYEQLHLIEVHNQLPITMAPPAVIYGCFVTKSCALLSRGCSLLLQYRKCVKENKNSASKRSIKWLITYAEDFVSALWYDNTFSNRLSKNRYFLSTLSKDTVENFQIHNMDSLLNIQQHFAVLPYTFTLNSSGLKIKSKKDANSVAMQYYTHINQFIVDLLGN